MLNYLLSVIGYKQIWHISWTAMKLGGEKSYSDAVVTISLSITGPLQRVRVDAPVGRGR